MTPAMRQGRQIFGRRSAMLFFIWEQILEMRPSAKNALVYALAQYGLDVEALRRAPAESGAELRHVAARELETWIHHEVGEVRENAFPGWEWHEIVSTYSNSPVEIFARVVKDLIADTHPEGLLGHMIQNDRKSSLGFYISFIRPFTKVMFPEIREAFEEFRSKEDWKAVEAVRETAHERAHKNAVRLLELHREGKQKGEKWAKSRILSELIEPLGILSNTE
jgi:hypothetical protein